MPVFFDPDWTHAFQINYCTLGLVKPYILELGVLDGRNALWMMEHTDCKYIGVDINLRPNALENLEKFKSRSALVQSDSISFMRNLKDELFDLVYVDSSHDYKHTLLELPEALRVVKTGGYVLCDDYNHQKYTGVKQAVDEFVPDKNLDEVLRNWQICFKKA